ncbi:ribbon-helix-helix domain-containing protein [Cellulomonas shaoxiangyii]|uniref:ribbon-helix-helix domain-containing protein n=1 Tax=Cellulomonas shaoxiangyii TaxID=2566013 RepID=UPI001FB6F68E|nr:ribbon-helix-helix domain-containing protein [Cellulomonas shaoxiangyii]
MSLPEDDVATLDRYVQQHPGATRSSAVQDAVRLLRDRTLQEQYGEAFAEWTASADASAWDSTSGDGRRGGSA